MAEWNPWHGCHKVSAGCQNCYMFASDAKYGRDSTPRKTATFLLPVAKNRAGGYKLEAGQEVFTCFTSDFLLEEADAWRQEAWQMIARRRDLRFLFITKRIERLPIALPGDWGEGYEHVTICTTCENQQMADRRLPVFLSLPIKHRMIICEPLLSPIDLSPYLGPQIEQVVAGGESGAGARTCRYAWVLDIREQCMRARVPFWFKQTGARFEKDGKLYRIPRRQQHSQARKAGINWGRIQTPR